MKILTEKIEIETEEKFGFISLTEQVKEIVRKSGIVDGFVNVFSKHTTLAIKINEYEELLLQDIKNFLEEQVPKQKEYLHDKLELRKNCLPNEPKNAEGHLRCLLLETSQTIPLIAGNMQLGKYQDIFAIETSGPRRRELIVQIIGEEK